MGNSAADYILPLGIVGAVVVGGYFLLKGGLPFFGDIGEGIKDFFDKLFGERAEPIITPEWEETQKGKIEDIQESMKRTREAIERVKALDTAIPKGYLYEVPFLKGAITYETAALTPILPPQYPILLHAPEEKIKAQMVNGRYIPSGRI